MKKTVSRKRRGGVPAVLLLAFFLLSLVLAPGSEAAPGDLDATFGAGGKVTTDFNGSTDEAFGIAVQADGKIVLGGQSYTSALFDLALARYNPDGSLDATFGTGGLVTTDFNGSADLPLDLAVQTDGRIVAAGYSWTGASYDLALARYLNGDDSDGDGVHDNTDACPAENATGFDADGNGCIDTTAGLIQTVDTLVAEGVVSSTLRNSLVSKVENAEASASKANTCAAVNELNALKNQIEAQRGKKISNEAADLLMAYVDSLKAWYLYQLPAGETC